MENPDKPETFASLGDKVAQVSDIYATRFDIERDALWHLGKLTEELGEVSAAYLALHGRGRRRGKEVSELDLSLEQECADLLAHLMLFARHCDIDLEAALRRKWFAYL